MFHALKSRLKLIENAKKCCGDHAGHLMELKHRMKGTTTALAFRYISMAMLDPGKTVEIRDNVDMRRAHQNCFEHAQSIVHSLELQGFRFNKSDLTVQYSLDW